MWGLRTRASQEIDASYGWQSPSLKFKKVLNKKSIKLWEGQEKKHQNEIIESTRSSYFHPGEGQFRGYDKISEQV